jgi:hypothetical protein
VIHKKIPRLPRRDRLGCFDAEDEAGLAYNAVALYRWGEFARLNDIPSTKEQLDDILDRLQRTRVIRSLKELPDA